MTIERALDALNNVAMDPKLTYEETRDGLLRIHAHVAHLLSHFPPRSSADTPARAAFRKRSQI